jgi:acid phosphatase class B
MKKVFYSLFAGLLLFTACGPNAEELAKEQQRIADSAAAAAAAEVQARMTDSLAQVEKMRADSMALEMQRIADSTRAVAVADSIAKAAKKSTPKPKKTQQQINEEKLNKEVKDATRGRG